MADPQAFVIDSGATYTIISDRVVKAEGPIVEISTGNRVARENGKATANINDAAAVAHAHAHQGNKVVGMRMVAAESTNKPAGSALGRRAQP